MPPCLALRESCRVCGVSEGISRRGLCAECRGVLLKEAGQKASRKRKSYFGAPSRQASGRRLTKNSAAPAARIEAGATAWPLLRDLPEGLVESELHAFLSHFDSFGWRPGEVRYVTDAIDVQVVSKWAAQARKSHGLECAMLGLAVAAHFNYFRTFGMVQVAIRDAVDWDLFRTQLHQCGLLWGDLTRKRPARGIYSPDCMPGSGLSPMGTDYYDRFVVHFGSLRQSAEFAAVCALVESGIQTNEQADKLRKESQRMRKVVPGMLGEYHYKMWWDFLVATTWCPASLVREYPVCAKGGTAQGLRRLYAQPNENRPRVLSRMLDDLTDAVKRHSCSWHSSDHCGSVGAQLCWLKRKATPSSGQQCADRYEQTTLATWERQLAALDGEGLAHFWR
jgi:hypothetical protein